MTSKQRAFLRGLANDIDPIFQVGKLGVTPVMAEEICNALEARELIKCTVLPNSGFETREACDRMCELTGAEGVQCIGNKFVIYKASRENPRIQLGSLTVIDPKSQPAAPKAQPAAASRYHRGNAVKNDRASRTPAKRR